MSTIAGVRETEKRLQEILSTMTDACGHDLDRLGTLLRNVTDDYAAAIRELEFKTTAREANDSVPSVRAAVPK